MTRGKAKQRAEVPTLAPPPDCLVCGNSRHICEGNPPRVTRCRCVLDYVRGMEYSVAGASPLHIGTPLADLVKKAGLQKLEPVLSKPLRAPFMAGVVVDRISGRRSLITTAALRLSIDAGRSAKFVSLDNCIATRFNEEERPLLYAEFDTLNLLIVDLDVQIANRMVPQLCMDIYSRRITKPFATLYLCTSNPAGQPGRYGAEFSSAFRSSIRMLGVRP